MTENASREPRGDGEAGAEEKDVTAAGRDGKDEAPQVNTTEGVTFSPKLLSKVEAIMLAGTITLVQSTMVSL